ncbi:gluconokinase [Vibrio litoralis]|uniref:gluconokinase n=1 Tax=Vibrio litoralis TaxID=335972 RepID=UPI00040AE718|nr:gluconokinase [Vibrio litoralis]
MNTTTKGYTFVFMGVTSCGKSTIGEAVAKIIGSKFIDGDDLHPRSNIEKMMSGQPLNDSDREPWLKRINDIAFSIEQKNEIAVVVSSALKRKYRDMLRYRNNKVRFIYLHGDYELILARMQARKGHFMPVGLIKSQFDVLEEPTDDESDVFRVSIDSSMEDVIDRASIAVMNVIEGQL